MKNRKLSALLDTPLGVVIVVAAVVLGIEFLIMVFLHEVLIHVLPLKPPELVWDAIDAIMLTAFVAPALYFLVFRKIQEDEQRFRQINAAALNAIVIVNEQALITGWNPAAQKMFQYSPEEAVGRQMHQLLAPPRYHDDAARGFAHFEETGGGPLIGKTTEIAALRKDGSEFPIELSISAVKLKDRWYAIGVIRDITERKETEVAFHTLIGTAATNIGAEFFKEVVSSLSAWLGVECVIVGELVDENKVRALAMQLDGKAIEHYEYALPGTPCNNVAHKGYCEYPEGVCQLFPSDKDLSDIGAEAYVGMPIRDKNGKTIGVLCAISRHKIVPPPMLKGVFEIIAARAGTEIERKRAEQALSNERDFAQSIIATAQTTILLLDTEGRIVSLNPYMENLSGWRLEEVRGKDWFSTFMPERNREATRKLFQTALSGIQTRGNVDVLLTRDGRELQIEWFDTTLKDSEGKMTGLLAIGQDVTERKQAEAKIAEQIEELRRWHDITMGREMRTIELKREVNELLSQAGQPPRYLSVEQSNAAAEGSLRSSGEPTGVPLAGE